jgi:hypothetical protein
MRSTANPPKRRLAEAPEAEVRARAPERGSRLDGGSGVVSTEAAVEAEAAAEWVERGALGSACAVGSAGLAFAAAVRCFRRSESAGWRDAPRAKRAARAEIRAGEPWGRELAGGAGAIGAASTAASRAGSAPPATVSAAAATTRSTDAEASPAVAWRGAAAGVRSGVVGGEGCAEGAATPAARAGTSDGSAVAAAGAVSQQAAARATTVDLPDLRSNLETPAPIRRGCSPQRDPRTGRTGTAQQ